MLVVMENHATQAQIDRVVHIIKEMGYEARPMPGETRTTVGLVGNDGRVDGSRLESLDGVAEIIHVSKPYKQVSREWRQQNTIVTIGPGVSVQLNGSMSSVLGNGSDGKALQVLRDIATHLRGGTPADGAALRGTDLKALDASLEDVSTARAQASSCSGTSLSRLWPWPGRSTTCNVRCVRRRSSSGAKIPPCMAQPCSNTSGGPSPMMSTRRLMPPLRAPRPAPPARRRCRRLRAMHSR